ncbi:hypothetical protein D3C80_2176730 [compost metagenome]
MRDYQSEHSHDYPRHDHSQVPGKTADGADVIDVGQKETTERNGNADVCRRQGSGKKEALEQSTI